ncbi:MAG: M1 family aminopeptidase [Pseudomonadota bacterium]
MKNLLIFVTLILVSQTAISKELVEYDTRVKFSIEQSELVVKTSIQIPASRLADQQTSLFLNKNFEIRELSGKDLADYSVKQSAKIPPWNHITLKFKETSKSDQTVTIEYAGVINSEAGHGNFIDSKGIHLSIDSAWHPFFTDFSTPMVGSTVLSLADDWSVFAPGSTSVNNDIIKLNSARPVIDVSLYAAPEPSTLKAGEFVVVYDEANAAKAKTVVNAGNKCLDSLNKRFGNKDKLEQAHAILLDRTGPSFARGSHISLNSETLGSETQIYQYLCHELVHNWTTLGNAMSHDYWMVESFAEYVAARELQQAHGNQAFEEVVEQWQARGKGHPFVWRADTERRASHNVNYGLGPLALMQLEERLGHQAFADLLDWYMAEEVLETESLLSQIAAVKDPDTSDWFKQLLQGESV